MNRTVVFLPLLLVALCLVIASCGGSASPQPTPQPVVMGFTPQAVCRVPDVVGLDQAVAEGLLAQLGLQPVKNLQYDATIAAGAVIAQRPAADTRLEPCQGDVDLIISRGEPPKPTDTPAPTNTPAPPTPTPTATPVPPTPTPTPDPRLFWDDFETGIRPDWNFLGNTLSATNGRLMLSGSVEGFVGNGNWIDYMAIFEELKAFWGTMQILVRVQDKDNHMLFECSARSSGVWHDCQWARIVNGEKQWIPGTHFNYWMKNGDPLRIEMDGNVYRTFLLGQQKLYFVDGTFSNGGLGIRYSGDFSLDGVEVRSIP